MLSRLKVCNICINILKKSLGTTFTKILLNKRRRYTNESFFTLKSSSVEIKASLKHHKLGEIHCRTMDWHHLCKILITVAGNSICQTCHPSTSHRIVHIFKDMLWDGWHSWVYIQGSSPRFSGEVIWCDMFSRISQMCSFGAI